MPNTKEDFFFKDFVESLPIGAYQADSEGEIIYCNKALAKILGYDDVSEVRGQNLADLYKTPEERDILLKKMTRGRESVHEFIYWRNKAGEEMCLSDSCQFVYNKDKKKCGVRGIIIDVWYEKLVAEMSEGAYVIGSDLMTIVKANPAVAKILGFDRTYEIEGKRIKEFYRHPEKDWKPFLEKLEKKGEVRDHIIPMKRKDGREIFISVNALPLKEKSGKIIGREGTFRDVTEAYLKHRILEDIPTGAFQALSKGDRSTLTYCNLEFAKMFGFDKPEEFFGKNLDDFHFDKEISKKYKAAMENAAKEGHSVLNYTIHLKKRNGERFQAKVDSHFLRDHEDKVIGRQGTLRDVTKLIQLEKMLGVKKTDLKENVHKFAHRFMAPITGIKTNAEIFTEELVRLIDLGHFDIDADKFENLSANPLDVFSLIVVYTREILSSLEEFLKLLNQQMKFQPLVTEIAQYAEEILIYTDKEKVVQIIELREAQRCLETYLNQHREDFSEDEDIKMVVDVMLLGLKNLNKLYLLFLADIISNTSKMAYVDVENLRSYLLEGEKRVKRSIEFRKEDLQICIREVVNVYLFDAIQKRLTFKMRVDEDSTYMDMSIEHAKLMLHYLIQNAVKYSFRRQDGFIKIAVNSYKNQVEIRIENYGVGILPEEIKSGEIFNYGSRGKFSNDLNRTGSGIGLSEAKKIVEMHFGTLTINSRPVEDGSESITQTTPHLTQVKVTLKRHQVREKK